MRMVTSRIIVLAAAAAVGGLTTAIAAQGQRQSQSDDVLAQLLTEVRGLRAAMEQMASAGPRVQLLLGRVQLEEQRINEQVRRLDGVRAKLQSTEMEAEALERNAKDMEAAQREAINPQMRAEIDRQIAGRKAEAARAQAELQRLTNEQSLISQDIAAEQNRWTEFNARLEELERVLSKR
jgi:chromosome segregation ATPase